MGFCGRMDFVIGNVSGFYESQYPLFTVRLFLFVWICFVLKCICVVCCNEIRTLYRSVPTCMSGVIYEKGRNIFRPYDVYILVYKWVEIEYFRSVYIHDNLSPLYIPTHLRFWLYERWGIFDRLRTQIPPSPFIKGAIFMYSRRSRGAWCSHTQANSLAV